MQSFKLSELEKVAGSIDLTEFVSGDTLAHNEVVFCISSIEDVPSELTKDGMQWKLTVHFVSEDEQGDLTTQETCYLSLGHNVKRDAEIADLQAALKEAKDGKLHSFRMLVHKFKQSARRLYFFRQFTDENNAYLCECTSH